MIPWHQQMIVVARVVPEVAAPTARGFWAASARRATIAGRRRPRSLRRDRSQRRETMSRRRALVRQSCRIKS